MILFIISLAVIVLGLAVFGYLIFKKIPDLKNLNVESLIEEKQGQAKAHILEAKFLRLNSKLKSKINKFIVPRQGLLAQKIQQIKDRVTEIEKQYKTGGEQAAKPKTVEELFLETKKLLRSRIML